MHEQQAWKILLIDDDEDDYLLTRSMLSNLKYRRAALEWVPNYPDGLKALQQNQYDAVLVDYDLGAYTGIELIRSTAARKYPAPLILYTGRGSYETDIEAMQAGATLYINKAEASSSLLERLIRYAIQLKKTETALRQARDEAVQRAAEAEEGRRILDSLMSCIPGGIAIADSLSGKVQMMSSYGKAQLQKLAGDFDGDASKIDLETWPLYHAGEDMPLPPHQFPLTRAAVLGEEIKNEKLVLKGSDGQQIPILCNAGPIIDSTGKVTGGVIAWQDITEQKRAELALRESQASFTSLLDTLQDGFFALDRDWNFTYINQIAASAGGRSPQELLGQNIWELWPQLLGTELEQRYRQVMESGIPFRFKYPGIIGNIWFEIAVNPTLDGISIYWVDISQRKQMEDRLEYLAHVLDNVHDAILAADENQIITAWNQAAEELYGWTEEEAIGMAGKTLLKSEFSDDQRAEVARQLEEFHRCSVEMVQYTKDGRRLVVEGKIIAIRNADGAVTGYVTSNRDITDRKQAVEALLYYSRELEQSNRELEEFAATASHDLQEPLRKIDAFSSLLETEIASGGENGPLYIERLRSAATRMQVMIDGLLALSQVRAKGHAFQPVQLNQLAQVALDNLEIRLKQTGGQVEISDLPTIEADPVQMVQLLQNLIGNALKFHRPEVPPLVKVEFKQSASNMVEILVIDNGIGFDPEHQDLIFQPFYRLHPKSEYDGTGMGLAICRKIAERHGGTIAVDSIPGQGSAFIVSLPITPIPPG